MSAERRIHNLVKQLKMKTESTCLEQCTGSVLLQHHLLLLRHFLYWCHWCDPVTLRSRSCPTIYLVPANPPPPSPLPFPSWPCHLSSEFCSVVTLISPPPPSFPFSLSRCAITALHHSVESSKGCLQDLAYWQGRLGVHRVPSVVFLRGSGALPAVYDASNTRRLDIAKLVADNSWQVLSLIYYLA